MVHLLIIHTKIKHFYDRKTVESKDFVEFECTSSLDLQNRNAPKRIITRKDFPSVGTFA